METILQILQGVEFDADLKMDAADGTLLVKTQADGTLLLDFSNEKTFRFFLKSLDSLHLSSKQLLGFFTDVTTLPYPVRIMVNGTEYLLHTPGKPLQWKQTAFFKQGLLNWLGI